MSGSLLQTLEALHADVAAMRGDVGSMRAEASAQHVAMDGRMTSGQGEADLAADNLPAVLELLSQHRMHICPFVFLPVFIERCKESFAVVGPGLVER